MSKYFGFIIATVILNATSQLLMKTGMNQVGQISFSTSSILSTAFGAATNIFVLLGLTTMAISMVTHLSALSRFDVSFAFPFLSLAYLIVMVYAYFHLGEDIGIARVSGTLLVVAGVVLISRS